MTGILALCGWCEHKCQMAPMGNTLVDHGGLGWLAYQCLGCGGLSLAQGELWGRPGQARIEDFRPNGWYPESPLIKTYPESVPPQIAATASDAWKCHSVGVQQGAAVLARAVVESAAKSKGITSGSLMKKIEELLAGGHIYPHVKDAADEIRHAGNDIAHGDLVDEPFTADEAEAVLELMDQVLDGVFIAPAKSAKQKARRLAKASGNTTSASPTGLTLA
jgi:hypothetical protein